MWHCGPAAPSWADGAGQSLTYHPTLDRASPPEAPKSGVSSDLVFAPGPVTVVRFSQAADTLLLMTMNGQAVSIGDLIETIAYYGLEHHYPLARGDWTDTFRELGAWTGIQILEKIPYRDYLVSPF
jgi:hypothetical protein